MLAHSQTLYSYFIWLLYTNQEWVFVVYIHFNIIYNYILYFIECCHLLSIIYFFEDDSILS